jgi:hypothetical protein
MITIAHVAQEVITGVESPVAFGNFLDAFYLAPDERMLQAVPPSIPVGSPQAAEIDAYLGATAERLARRSGLAIPAWAFHPSRYLHVPFFANEGAALRATLLLESPPEFRTRNLFVTSNALDRASQHHGHAA